MAKKMPMFKGKESQKEEMAEANAVKKGKISPRQYAKGEAAEGHGKGAFEMGKKIKSGKVTPKQYAKNEKK